MHLLLSIAGFCLTFGGINAASISGRAGIQSLSETADVSLDDRRLSDDEC
jgi:hypothetical protein